MTLKLSPQPILIAILFLLVFSAIFVLWIIGLYLILKIVLSVALIFYGIYALNRYYFLLSSKSILEIECKAKDDWKIRLYGKDEFLSAALLEHSIFTSRLMILIFNIPNSRVYSTVLFLGKNNRENFRRLIRIHNGLTN